MRKFLIRRLSIVTAIGLTVAALAALPVAQATGATSSGGYTSTSYSGSTSDGGQWVGDVPTPWNGTVLLYSHGFGPPQAADAPDSNTKAALLARGYALVGSSYDPTGSWWALGSALQDQTQALSGLEAVLPHAPAHVIAFGTSMGGLISALEDQHGTAGIDGALTTCGLVAGAVQLNNYQLDGEYAIAQLLDPGVPIKLVGFSSPADGLATGNALQALATQAQQTAAGRARLALAMALMNVATWAPGEPLPNPHDYGQQEREQYNVEFVPAPNFGLSAMQFVEFGRYSIEQAAGGNGAWDAGVNFAQLLRDSPYAGEVRALYRRTGLKLYSDLADLTAHANITADPSAVQWLQQTSVPSGTLTVPELDIHTIADQLIPVQQENYYRRTVQLAGDKGLLRQAYVQRQSHCNFTPAELVASVLAIQHRVDTGRWGRYANPAHLNRVADSLGIGSSAFIHYRVRRLSGDNGTSPRTAAGAGSGSGGSG